MHAKTTRRRCGQVVNRRTNRRRAPRKRDGWLQRNPSFRCQSLRKRKRELSTGVTRNCARRWPRRQLGGPAASALRERGTHCEKGQSITPGGRCTPIVRRRVTPFVKRGAATHSTESSGHHQSLSRTPLIPFDRAAARKGRWRSQVVNGLSNAHSTKHTAVTTESGDCKVTKSFSEFGVQQPEMGQCVLQFTRPPSRNSLRPSTMQGTKRSIARPAFCCLFVCVCVS